MLNIWPLNYMQVHNQGEKKIYFFVFTSESKNYESTHILQRKTYLLESFEFGI